jgi:hypothetical protein
VLEIEPIEPNSPPSAVRFDGFKAQCGAVRFDLVDKKFGSRFGSVLQEVGSVRRLKSSSAVRFEGSSICSMWRNVKRYVFLKGSYRFMLQLHSRLNCCTRGHYALVLIAIFVGTILSP